MKLPNEIIGQIASFLEPEEFLDTLPLVSEELAARLVGEVKWSNLDLDDTINSLRIAVFTSAQGYFKCLKKTTV